MYLRLKVCLRSIKLVGRQPDHTHTSRGGWKIIKKCLGGFAPGSWPHHSETPLVCVKMAASRRGDRGANLGEPQLRPSRSPAMLPSASNDMVKNYGKLRMSYFYSCFFFFFSLSFSYENLSCTRYSTFMPLEDLSLVHLPFHWCKVDGTNDQSIGKQINKTHTTNKNPIALSTQPAKMCKDMTSSTELGSGVKKKNKRQRTNIIKARTWGRKESRRGNQFLNG